RRPEDHQAKPWSRAQAARRHRLHRAAAGPAGPPATAPLPDCRRASAGPPAARPTGAPDRRGAASTVALRAVGGRALSQVDRQSWRTRHGRPPDRTVTEMTETDAAADLSPPEKAVTDDAPHLLIIDDDSRIRSLLSRYLG